MGRNESEIGDSAGTLMLVERTTNNNIYRNNHGNISTGPNDQAAQQAGCAGSAAEVTPSHFEGWNYLFVDGHVKWLKPEATVSRAAGGTLSDPKGMWTIAVGD